MSTKTGSGSGSAEEGIGLKEKQEGKWEALGRQSVTSNSQQPTANTTFTHIIHVSSNDPLPSLLPPLALLTACVTFTGVDLRLGRVDLHLGVDLPDLSVCESEGGSGVVGRVRARGAATGGSQRRQKGGERLE